MACPLFLPALDNSDEGQCAGDPTAFIPADTLRRCCNNGYARGVCQRAAGADADAMRFLIRAHRGGVVEVAWSIERNHHPVAVGSLEITEMTPTEQPPLERQARACAASYLRLIGATS